MDGLNRVMLLGNLGADPELHGAKTSVLKMTLACTEAWFDDRRQRQERTEWVRVAVFGARAEALGKILSKGDRIFVEGSLRTSSYERDGETRYSTEVVAGNVILAGGRRDSEPGASRERRAPARTPRPRPAASADDFGSGFGGADGDIPF